MLLRDEASTYLVSTTERFKIADLDRLEALLLDVAVDAQAKALEYAAARADEAADKYNMPMPGERLSEKSDRGIQARTARALAFAIRSIVPGGIR